MAESGGGGDGGGEIMMTPKEMIETLIREIDDLAGEAYSLTGNNSMSTTYRCSTCTKLSHEHPNGNVKGCNRKALTTDEYIADLKRQRDGLTDHVLLLRDGAQASVDKKEYKRLLHVQTTEINGLQNQVLVLETRVRDDQNSFNVKVVELQDSLSRVICEAKTEKAHKETIKAKLEQMRVNYAMYEHTSNPEDWEKVHKGLEAALKEAGVMGVMEDLGALRGVVLRHLPADTSGGGVINGDDLSWDYAGAPDPTATTSGAPDPAATATGASRPAATTSGAFPPTALALGVPLPDPSTSRVPFPAAASTDVHPPSAAADDALPPDPASSAARASASPSSNGSVEIDSFSDTSTLCPTPDPSAAVSTFDIPDSPHPTPSQCRTPTPTRPPSRPLISSELTKTARDLLNHKNIYDWHRKNHVSRVTIPATIPEGFTLPYGAPVTTTPVRATASVTLPKTLPPPVSPRPSHPPPRTHSHPPTSHLPPHPHSPPTAPHHAPHSSPTAPHHAPLPAPAAPILPPVASAAPISPPVDPAAPTTTHVSVGPHSLSMAPPPHMQLRDDSPPPEPRKPRPPGLMEVEGVELIHQQDGHVCGGHPETHLIAKLLKFVKPEFKSQEKIDVYLKKKKELMNCFKATFPSETLYTLVNIFTLQCDSELCSYIEELTAKKSYFTSFEMFLREFEEQVYPNSRQAAYTRFINRSTPSDAKIAVAWKQFKEDARLVNLDPLEHNMLFIRGIRHREKKKALLQKWLSTKDMDEVLEEAVSLESTYEMMTCWDQDEKEGKSNQKSNTSNNANISAISASGNGKAGKQQQQQGQQQQQQQHQQQNQQQQDQLTKSQRNNQKRREQLKLGKQMQKQMQEQQQQQQQQQQTQQPPQQQQGGGRGGGRGGRAIRGSGGGGGRGGGNAGGGGGGGKDGGVTVAANEVQEAAIKQNQSNQPVSSGWTGPLSAQNWNLPTTLSAMSTNSHNNLIPPNEALNK